MMTSKEYLREFRRIKAAIDAKTERRAQMQAIAERLTPIISDMPRGGSDPERMAKLIESIADFDAEIAQEALLMVETLQELQTSINQIERQDYRTVLELYYLNGYSWDRVALKMGYSVRNIHYLHSEALAEFESLQ